MQSASSIMTTVKIKRAFIHLRSHIHLYIIHMKYKPFLYSYHKCVPVCIRNSLDSSMNKVHHRFWRAKSFGVFRVKNHDFTPKNHIFSNFRVRPPLDPPLMMSFWFVLLGLCFLCSVLYIVVCTFLLAIVFVCPSNYDFWLPLRYLQNLSSLRFPDIYTWSVFSMVCLSTSNITIRVKLSTTYWIDWLIFGVLTPLSTIFQLYHGDQF
jgi:hypothetical protein